MTLAKACHANNMMQNFKKQLMGLLQPQKLSMNGDASTFHCCIEKNASHIES